VPFDFSQFSAVLIDLDGTLYLENTPLPGAVELIRTLREKRLAFGCLSNTTESPTWANRRLGRMGIEVDPSLIYTATASAADYVTERFGERPRVYNLATSGVGELLENRCIWVTGRDEPCDAVIIGTLANDHVNPDRTRTALALVRNGAACVGICADRVYPGPHGMEFGSGSLTWMLAYAANVTPVFCGKPEAHFFQHACDRLRAKPESCLLIGDNYEADIAGAKPLGIKTILVLTGVTTRDELQRIPAPEQPDRVIQTLTDLL
jgi:HAD superfamily hydrolase (TIGR01450 family)